MCVCVCVCVCVQLVNVNLNELVCHVTARCPQGCTCVKRPFNHSFEVSCPPAILHSLPDRLPDPDRPAPRYGRFRLRFRGSLLSRLESRAYFANTSRLDVSNSGIEEVTDDAWRSLQTIDMVDLSHNRLTRLPPFLQSENITFRWIALHGNPLNCDCGHAWYSTWLKSLGAALHQPDSVKCRTPGRLEGQSVVSLDSAEFCRNPDLERFVYALKVRRLQCSFRQPGTTGRMASQAEIGVWVQAPEAILPGSGGITPKKI